MKTIDSGTRIVIDTCILDHLIESYMSKGSVILDILIKYKKNLWIPYTVYQEFARIDDEKFVEKRVKRFEEDKVKREAEVSDNDEKMFSLPGNAETYRENIEAYYKKVKAFMHELEKNGQIGRKFTESEMKNICEEGKKRYEKNIPPGLSDKGKKGEKKYNDLFIWKEILRYFGEEKKITSILFMTDDQKGGIFSESGKEGEERVINEFMKKEFEALCCFEGEERQAGIDVMTLLMFQDLCKNEFNIQEISELKDDKVALALLENYGDIFANDLLHFVENYPSGQISSDFYLDNDGEVNYRDPYLMTWKPVCEDGKIYGALRVGLDCERSFVYEDEDGNTLKLGDAKIQISAIVSFFDEYIENPEANCYRLISKKKEAPFYYKIDINDFDVVEISLMK